MHCSNVSYYKPHSVVSLVLWIAEHFCIMYPEIGKMTVKLKNIASLKLILRLGNLQNWICSGENNVHPTSKCKGIPGEKTQKQSVFSENIFTGLLEHYAYKPNL